MTASKLTVVELPTPDLRDVAGRLRSLADDVEAGKFGDALNCAWVIDRGDNSVAIGLMGASPDPAATAHFLFALGMRKLESVANLDDKGAA